MYNAETVLKMAGKVAMQDFDLEKTLKREGHQTFKFDRQNAEAMAEVLRAKNRTDVVLCPTTRNNLGWIELTQEQYLAKVNRKLKPLVLKPSEPTHVSCYKDHFKSVEPCAKAVSVMNNLNQMQSSTDKVNFLV